MPSDWEQARIHVGLTYYKRAYRDDSHQLGLALVRATEMLLPQADHLLDGRLSGYGALELSMVVRGDATFQIMEVTRRRNGLDVTFEVGTDDVMSATAEQMTVRVLAYLCLVLDALIERENTARSATFQKALDSIPTPPRPLPLSTFWRYIDAARAAGRDDAHDVTAALSEALSRAKPATLVGFHLRLVERLAALNTAAQREAAELIFGFLSEDFFLDWRAWLITRGRKAYDLVLADPDALAEVPGLDSQEGAEALLTVADDLYKLRTDERLDLDPFYEVSSHDEHLRRDHGAIRAALPRLAARYPYDGLGRPPVGR